MYRIGVFFIEIFANPKARQLPYPAQSIFQNDRLTAGDRIAQGCQWILELSLIDSMRLRSQRRFCTFNNTVNSHN